MLRKFVIKYILPLNLRQKKFTFYMFLVFFIIFTGILLLVYQGTHLSEIFSYTGFICVFGLLLSLITDYLGEKKHQSIIYSDKIKQLQTDFGFQIENLNRGRYFGYKGVYNDYFFRIYYNWNSSKLITVLSGIASVIFKSGVVV